MQTLHLLFDGAMGTYYAQKYEQSNQRCELANLTHPERIRDIHREYLAAGATAIKTNTFATNCKSLACDGATLDRVIAAGLRIAKEAAADYPGTRVFADIGPLPPGQKAPADTYRSMADRMLAHGAENFMLETMDEPEGLAELCTYLKSQRPDGIVILSFAASPDGFTRKGFAIQELFAQLGDCPAIDALGLNCMSGPYHYLQLLRRLPPQKKPLAILPNAGYPTVVGERTFFGDNPGYFAEVMADIASCGVPILGGCCGTTPEYIRQTARTAAQAQPGQTAAGATPDTYRAKAAAATGSRLKNKLDSGKRVIAVELDPPADTDLSFFLSGAQRLKRLEVDAITIADCPVARARVDSSLLAAKIHRELDVDVLPHLTCRDRNLNATKALLLGLNIEQVDNVLVVTGDPIPAADRSEVRAVFNFNSVLLANYIHQLNQTVFSEPFHICSALNINAGNFSAELKKAQRKQAAGVTTFLTQPAFTQRSMDNLALARQTLEGCYLLGGIIPVVSYRNACFMNSEMAGIEIPQEVIDQYEGLSREQAGDLAVRLAEDIARRILPVIDGFYLITPLKRLDLIERLIPRLRALD